MFSAPVTQSETSLGWLGGHVARLPVRDVRKITALLRQHKDRKPDAPGNVVIMPYGITVGEYCATQFMLQTIRRRH